MTQKVTPRQMQILKFIRDYRRENGYSPSLQEIGDQLDLTKVTVYEHVCALVEGGLLRRGAKHTARSLELTEKAEFADDRPTRIPMAGRIAAGLPIEAVEDRETLDLEQLFQRPVETFILEVTGDSMIEDHICDGDYVVCEKRNTARNGETVVALLSEGEATLKRFYREKGRIRLQPANAAFEPIYTDAVEIQGVVIGVLRIV